jgi:hypothetical protein
MPGGSRVNSLNRRLKGLAAGLSDMQQNGAISCARELQELLETPRRIFARFCPELCPTCAEACCGRVSHRGVMDEADLVYLAAQGVSALPQAARQDGLCPWLADAGCALSWKARPFACLHYVCEPLQNAMSPAELQQVRAALAQAGDARSHLLKLFLEL